MTAETLGALLRARAGARGEQVCVVAADGRRGLTYRELDRRASLFAAALGERGCGPGDRVVLGLGNSPDFFTALWGCLRGGQVAVPLDSNLAAEELRAVVEHAGPALAVADTGTRPRLEPVVGAAELATLTQGRLPAAPRGRGGNRHGEPASAPTSESPALLLYTSGTTGAPKGVELSHRALLHRIESIGRWLGFGASPASPPASPPTSLCLLPTHFGHGLICNCLSTVGYGGTLVIARPFDLDLLGQLWEILARHEVRTFSSVPTVVRLLCRAAERRAVRVPASLRLVTCASAPLFPEDIETFEGHFGVPLLNCYGLTETSGWSACSPDDPERDLASVGRALSGEIRAVGTDGAPLPPGERGELEIRNPGLMNGYYRHPAATREVLRDGWLATGDLGWVDLSGAVFVVSRIKELIIRAGKNIVPVEVDGALTSHPEVVEAWTVGLDDPLLGERVAACVVRSDGASVTEAELIAHAQTKLAAYKCPQRILFVDQIPKTSRGKVNRARLRPLFGG
jgi:long-chain acyl-CoA synthetase